MPSFLSTLFSRSKTPRHPAFSNPYLDPRHPSHLSYQHQPQHQDDLQFKIQSSSSSSPHLPTANSFTTSAQAQAQARAEQLRPASPREGGDLLAEARRAVGRDPVTGRKSTPDLRRGRGGGAEGVQRSAPRDNDGRGGGESAGRAGVGGGPSLVQSAFANGGGGEGAVVWRSGEYYAPQRRVEEYYGGV